MGSGNVGYGVVSDKPGFFGPHPEPCCPNDNYDDNYNPTPDMNGWGGEVVVNGEM